MYQHKTNNHLIFDFVRDLQFRLKLLRSYIRDENEFGDYEDVILAINRCDALLYDCVYLVLRDMWEN